MSTWAETIKQYDTIRKGPAFQDFELKPVVRVKAYERKAKEREVDPILSKYRDPVKQEMVESTNFEKMKSTLEKTDIIRKNKFNFVTHEGPEKEKPHPREYKKSRDWNILSHLPQNVQGTAPIIHDPQFSSTYSFTPKSLTQLSGLTLNAGGRDTNIITNKFLHEHEFKVRQEEVKLKEKIVQKYWQTHEYNPIRGQFYDNDREADFLEQRRLLEGINGLANATRVPPSLQNSEGGSYDIITAKVTNPEALNATLEIANRSLNRVMQQEIEYKVKEESDMRESINQSRATNRIKYGRMLHPDDRDFNPVTNTDTLHRSTDLVPPPPPKWTLLQPTTANNKPRDLSGGTFNDSQYHSYAPTNVTVRPLTTKPDQLVGTGSVRNDMNRGRYPSVSTAAPRMIGDTARGVPQLNLAMATPHTPVSYVEPKTGPPGLAVPVVRTGGWA